MDLNIALDQKTQALLLLFGVYIGLIVSFGMTYWRLYLGNPLAFAFNSDILRSQVLVFAKKAAASLTEIQATLGLLQKASDYIESRDVVDVRNTSKWYQFRGSWEATLGSIEFSMSRSVVASPAAGVVALIYGVNIEDKETGEKHAGTLMEGPYDLMDLPEVVGRWAATLEWKSKILLSKIVSLNTEAPQVWSVVDFLYFSLISQTTVGFGDILPNSTGVRAVVGLQVILGYVLLIVVLNVILTL